MKFIHGNSKILGTALPLASIATEKNAGCGEFTDLIDFCNTAAEWGLSLIQLLPVNDTGVFSSPYSALSSCALNPVYLSIDKSIDPDGEKFTLLCRQKHASKRRFDYEALYHEKEVFLKSCYEKKTRQISEQTEILEFEKNNPWIKAYAVYKIGKKENSQKHWKEWQSHWQNPDENFINSIYENQKSEAFFYTWVQFHCDRQFQEAALAASALGIALKGDLPILMNEDSADVWAHPHLFDTSCSAGAPPDMFSDAGQNWGFPLYRWENHQKDEFKWWKMRLHIAQKYYQAFRIDHVLGFFRIWSILPGCFSGDLGFYNPSIPLNRQDLEKAGFDEQRLTWMELPHISGNDIRKVFTTETDKILDKIFVRVKDEDLFWFKNSITNEKELQNAWSWSAGQWDKISAWYKNRMLLNKDGSLYPYWHYKNTKAYLSFNDDEKNKFNNLVHKAGSQSEQDWEIQGKNLLSFMQTSTDMLVCAEDLGAVPSCVPRVLKELQILSLKIIRWTRDWEKEKSPFIPVEDYPQMSVATASVHDTSTLRAWWDEEAGLEEKEAFLTALNLPVRHAVQKYTAKMAAILLSAMTAAHSSLLIFQIQDLLVLDPDYSSDTDDRINVPGTVTDTNWTYKFPASLEILSKSATLKTSIKGLATRRKG